MSIWSDCQGQAHIKPISGTLFRLVESQEQVATMGYVDTLDEQAVLEELLELSKPDYPENTSQDLHYLLKTPFRYPPLEWGSRFGQVYEPSLFYGGASLAATLSEAAYYRFVFWQSIDGTPPSPRLKTEHTVFTVGYKTKRGIQLQQPPFKAHQPRWGHKQDYSAAQTLGSDMRDADVEAFQYVSARAEKRALCSALFTPAPFTSSKPKTMEPWLCEVSEATVIFKAVGSPETYHYPIEQFLVEGTFPLPA